MVFQEYNLVERLSVMENLLCGRLGYVSAWRAWRRKFPAPDVQRAFELLDVHSEFFCISCKRSAIERVLITIHHLGHLEKLSLPSCGIAGKGRIYSVLVDLLERKVADDKPDVCTKFGDHLLHQRAKSGTSRTLKINKCNDGHLCS